MILIMINIFCVLVKPGYNIKYVENLYEMCSKYISKEFKFNCLTDSPSRIENNIYYHNIEKFELDTWWNKLLIFHNNYSSDDINLYFDLDIKIQENIDCLIDDIEKDILCVVDTPWKDDWYFNQTSTKIKDVSAFLCYGNTSVMGWIGKSQHYIYDNFDKNMFEILKDNFGDDTYINRFAKVKYFKKIINPFDSTYPIIINYKKID